MEQLIDIASIPGVAEVEVCSGPETRRDAPCELLIEVPHGATRRRHFDETRRRLEGEFPDDLVDFFLVNTDVGSIECARWVARMLTSPAKSRDLADLLGTFDPRGFRPPGKVMIVRGVVPRTFVDCNRVIDGGPTGEIRSGVTPGLPEYITQQKDVATLTRLHGDYQSVAERAYESVCGDGGSALILHTYAPRSVRIDRVDDGIVAALRRAYEPATYAGWTRRPDVDVISEADDGTTLAPAGVVDALREQYARIEVEVAENATYRLFPETMGYLNSVRYPGQIVCIEINRGLLADPFTPFEEMKISDAKARKMAAPIAAACLSEWYAART